MSSATQTNVAIPKIGIYVPTRNRKSLCVSTLNAWSHLANNNDYIQFVVGVDEDEADSYRDLEGSGLQLHVFSNDIITCGGRVKELSSLLDVDIYLAIVDYYFPLTQYWDEVLRNVMTRGGVEIANLVYAPAPTALHATACSKKWIQLANKFEPDIFPFWFSDQWRVEMHAFVFGKAFDSYPEIQVGGAHSARTNNMHDVDYWWGLFHSLRPLRIREAYEVYKGYDLSCPTLKEFTALRRDLIDMFIRVDLGKRKQLDGYQQLFGALGEPSVKYLRAKANADKLIKKEKLELWKMKF